ncbi:MAG: metal ABC transporter solute-binding protein, Zn/Mn family [Cytophagaceae bacterium]
MRIVPFSITGICFLLTACGTDSATKKTEGKLQIVTTTGMIADAVLNIAGDKVEITALMGPGVDPHLYKATQGDVSRLKNASLVFYNGLHLEGKMGDVLGKLDKNKVIPVSRHINESKLRKSPQFADSHDPHIWFDVKLWMEAVREISAELQKLDTVNAALYEKNAQAYLLKLDSLDAWTRSEIQSIPQSGRILITAHDAFGYFGDAYGIEVKGLQGISTLSEFGLNDVTGLVNLIAARKVKAVFVESSVPKKSIEAVVEGCKNQGHEVKIGGTLFSDAMGPAGTQEGTYIGMVKANVNTIVRALK